jgi:hypothetical protein
MLELSIYLCIIRLAELNLGCNVCCPAYSISRPGSQRCDTIRLRDDAASIFFGFFFGINASCLVHRLLAKEGPEHERTELGYHCWGFDLDDWFR